MLHVALFEPEIPPNTGSIIRLCANTGARLHLIEPLGFDLDEKKVRRAGLDYRDMAIVTRHANWEAFLETVPEQAANKRIFALTTKATRGYCEPQFQDGDVLLFGTETRGLPEHIHAFLGDSGRVRIPMQADSRSINLSNSVSIVLYEALRQLGFPDLA